MKTFIEHSKDLNKTNVDKALTHDWATHINHPRLGEMKVDSHSLDEDGNIEEYYVGDQTFKATEVKITQMQEHKHGPKKKNV